MSRQYLDSLNSYIVEQAYLKKGGKRRRICAVDSTGFSIWRYVRWLTIRHGRKKRRKDFLKLHFIVDRRTLLILSFKVIPPFKADSKQVE
ncbi:MAG: hypothetical protein JRN46_02125 [Nitrososphaerota archaeon]|nr:hypothetical protein [Nitrososphaerota archaeon]